jgi:hypothetical protein
VGAALARAAKPRQTSLEKWQNLAHTDKVVAVANAAGQVLGKGVAAVMLVATGAEVFHVVPDFIDPTRAMDIFAALCAYFGVPLLWSHRSRRTP